MRVYLLVSTLIFSFCAQAFAESASITWQTTQMLIAADNQNELLCSKLKRDPTCVASLTELKNLLGLSASTCLAQKASLKCDEFITKFPQYKKNQMSCQPYDICRTALTSTAGLGCAKWGLEIKGDLIAMVHQVEACAADYQCIKKVFISFLKFAAAPQSAIAMAGMKAGQQMVDDFKKDLARFKKLACLDPETQAEFTCSRMVNYGSAIIGVGSGAGALAKLAIARAAALEADLLASEVKAVVQESVRTAERTADSASAAKLKESLFRETAAAEGSRIDEAKVIAKGEIRGRGQIFTDVNQTARSQNIGRAEINTPVPEERVAHRAEESASAGHPVGRINSNMDNAHAEVGVVTQAQRAGLTRDAEMEVTVTGERKMCKHCQGDLPYAACNSGLRRLKLISDFSGEVFYWQRPAIGCAHPGHLSLSRPSDWPRDW